MLHLALIAVTLLTLAVSSGPSPMLLVVGLAWVTLHVRLHQRFWTFTLRDLQRALRGRQ